jgi:hypothetical protein
MFSSTLASEVCETPLAGESQTQFSVGPVLQSGSVADAVISAIEEANTDVVLQLRGSYTRVLVPGRCTVRRVDVEKHLGRRIELPRELEKVMPSFKGVFILTDDKAEWSTTKPPLLSAGI